MTRREPEFFHAMPVGDYNNLIVRSFDYYSLSGKFELFLKAMREAREAGEDFMMEPLDHPGVHIEGRAWKWPRVIAPFYDEDPMILREDVAVLLEASELCGFELQKVKHRGWPPWRLLFSRRPGYSALWPSGAMCYAVRVYERIEKRLELRFETSDSRDPELKRFKHCYPWEKGPDYVFRKMPLVDTWDETDTFHLVHRIDEEAFPKLSSFYCTRAFLDFVRRHDWEGFVFNPIDCLTPAYVDFRERPWPPSLWYSSEHPE